MSYIKDLDEYTTDQLQTELDMRRFRLEAGNCDYCGRSGSESVCRFQDRHLQARKVLEDRRAAEARRCVCGLQGYDPMRDPPCPGCETR